MREVSKTNRILSLVLCVCMVLSMVPGYVLPVQAEGADSVCTCESSDPNGHAPFCDLYIVPENPACYCVAKCNEGNTNEYCDVCYFAPDACAASGEEDAALYASSYNYITSLTVGYSSKSASTAKEYASKDSHTVIDVDLNMDAGGDYVYMGYKTSSSPSNAITGIIFDDSGSESITYNGTTFYVLGGSKEPNASGDGKVDLNRDAKGAYIYVYITRDPGYDLPLTDITIGTAQETDIWWEPGCNRDNGKVQDLNQDTGDTPIYLYYNTKYTVAYECHYLKADGSTGKKSGEKQIYELNGTASYLPDVNDNPTSTVQKITSIPEHITYNGESYTFVGLREDNTVDSPTYYYLPEGYGGFQSKPTFTIKDTTRVFRAVYIHSEIRIKYNPNGGTITSGTDTAINSYWLLAGSNGVLGGYLDYTVWDMASRIKAPENKCAFLGWRIDNTGTTYNGGDKVNLTKDTTFYARWSDHTLINNVCKSCGYSNAVPSLVNGVYQIGNKAELIWFAQYVNKGNTGANAKLTADIDMSGYNWTPIVSTALYHSTTSYPNKGYTGTFDGNYHSISNLTIQAVSGDPDASYGLFGTLSGTVKNLGMKNFKFTGAGMDTRVGTVVGQMLSGALVENCYANTGNINTKVNTTNGVAGGIAGCNYGGTIRGCLLLNYTFNAGRHSGIVGDNRGDISSSDRKGTVVNCVTDYSTIQSKDRTGTVTNSLSGLNDTRLASGEAAWTLNGNSSSGAWKQTVGTGVPAFTGKTVYYGYLSCAADAEMCYTNDSSASTTKSNHSWADADCDTPKTCKICGKTEGNALDHDWKAADCNTPKTCKLCGKTEGNALDHDWKAADCDTRKTCKICGKTEGNALGHSYTNGFCTVCSGYQPATGIGSPKDPYKIGNAGQLYWFADRVNSGKTSVQAELTADIVVNENVLKADGTLNEGTYRTWKPIGNLINKYSGSFDGKGYTVSGLYFNYSNSSYVGMFGYVSGGTVQNVGVVDSYISGSDYVGGVVGYKEYGAVTNCYHTGTVSGVKYVGGMIGSNKRCLVTKCYHTGTVSGKDHIGSVVGYIYSSSTVTNCYYDCTVYNGDAVGVNAGCTVTDVMGKTTEQFASGEVAYLLQGEQTEQVWGQNIDGEGEKDAYPVFSDAKVYQILNCVGAPAGYSNTEDKDAVHSYTNGFCTVCDSYEPATGSGTESDPYKIGNAGQLYWFADQVNSGLIAACAELTAHIVVNENVLNADGTLNEGTYRTWKPIGILYPQYNDTFDGKGYTVSGLYFNDSKSRYVGLFGSVSGGTVQNVGVVDSYLSGEDNAGGVVGYTNGGTVINCYNTGTVSGENYVGGVVGYTIGGTVINCYNTGTVSGSSYYVGGVVGYNNSSTVTNCYNTGTVSGIWCVGGVVGCINSSSTVTNCYYDCTVYNGYAVDGNGGGIVTDVMGKTTEQFASGEVAYLLSLGCTVGEGEDAVTYPGDIWGQNIDGVGEKDAYPVFSDAKVYAILNCNNEPVGYSNTESDALGHDWKDADCDTPKTCIVCGTTEGEALGHDWKDADCDTPKTCTVCGTTEGEALGHDWQDNDGDTIRTCTICGITECYVLGHHYSTQWSYDHTNHWRECPCGERTDYQKHESENCRCGFVEADVYVGGVGMADGQYLSNSGAISADPPSGGYAFYQNGVLTLHDYVYTGTGYAYRGTRTAAIYSGGDLEIVLEGTNSLTNTFGSEDAIGNGILCSDLTIRGTGSLNIESMSVCISAQGDLSISDCTISVQSANDYGLYANYDEGIGNLTIDNATLNITAGDTGIYIRENATISGSTITMDAGKDGIYSENDVTINGSNVTITCDASDSQDGGAIVGRVISIVDSTLDATCNGEASCIMSVDYIDQSDLCVRITNSNVSIHGGMAGVLSYGEIIITGGKLTVADTGMAAMAALGGVTLNQVSIAQPVGGSIGTLQGMYITLEADGETFATAVVIDNTCEHSNASDDSDCTTPVICPDCGTMITAAKEHSWIAADCDTPKTCNRCGTTEGDALSHKDADDSGRCDKCNCLMQPARLRMASISMNGNIAINYYMLLSDEVLADETAYMQFTMVDGTVTRIPVADGIRAEYNGETYYAFSCAVDSKEMTDDVVCQFFYEGGSTAPFTYNVQTYANNILAKSGNDTMKALVRAMLHYGAASQIHFGYNTDNLANAELAAPDYSDVSIEGFDVISGQGTELAKFYSASLILKSETTLRFFFQVDSAATFTASHNGQTLEVKLRSGLYYVDVVGIAAKDLDEDVTITINDGTNTTEVSFNPMSYCQGVLNDTTGAFDRNIKDVVAALYLYNQAANIYFKES